MNRETAYRLHHVIAAGRDMVDDMTASIAPELYAQMQNNSALIKAGTRINWHGVLKRAAVDLWDTEANDPEHAPTLWEDIMYREGIRIIPETITAGTAFALDEQGWWEDVLYRSKIAANVWTPAQYPDGWEVVER